MGTREPFNKDVDKILERYGLDVPAWAMLASDLADLFDSVQIDNERLKAALKLAIDYLATIAHDENHVILQRLRAALAKRGE